MIYIQFVALFTLASFLNSGLRQLSPRFPYLHLDSAAFIAVLIIGVIIGKKGIWNPWL